MRTFLLIFGLLAYSMTGIVQGAQTAPPTFAPPASPLAPPKPLAAPPSLQNETPPAQSIQPLPPPADIGPLPNTTQPPPASGLPNDPLMRKPEAGDDELRRLLKERYNEALYTYKSKSAAYANGTAMLDDLVTASANILHAELELSDKPADRIAAMERNLEITKRLELQITTAYQGGHRGGEADKYHQIRYKRLDAEIQLLRAKRQAGLAK